MLDEMLQDIEEQYEVLYSEVLCSSGLENWHREIIDKPFDAGIDEL